ncbi:succinylglutamate desuccinylase/aspartoacylase family protein [Pseudomonas panipatensis]|uniref:Succinylglutamate desuccinylase/Aspartoacylase catalytic domain-containing protein n=1 Tax=Pseudomonas panipatensis TaxID=428992 RepID=A0A1G8BQR5_9PSED|nr:succinylglutamate desuccinylase/aspartoacylase family protein [Pseudomonas panipatensis]SDH35423.1 hypothetical protein SAMN05216272_101178 [Pseudomonas panipatensis]SMP71637.1 hypothetical protein SAMN06295951_110159 [Pseudomonas panipatensis]
MEQHKHPLIAPLPGTARSIQSVHFGPADGGRKVYIQASLHADELPGMLVAWHLKQRLRTLEAEGRLRGEIVLVPVANPIGLDQQVMDTPLGRYELESGQNFNRAFVDLSDDIAARIEAGLGADAEANLRLIRSAFRAALAAQAPLSQLQSMRLTLQRLACDAELVIDLHCDFQSVEHLYTTPQAWPDLEPLARYLGCKASLLAEDSGGQSFDECFSLVWTRLRERFAGRFPIADGCQAVTVELRGQADVSHDLATRDAQALLDYLIWRGLIDGQAPEAPPLPFPATPLAGVEPLHAPCGGVLVLLVEPGRWVEAGTLIAEIIDPLSDQVAPIHNQHAGVLYARSLRRMASAGMLVAHIAGRDAYRSGYLLQP